MEDLALSDPDKEARCIALLKDYGIRPRDHFTLVFDNHGGHHAFARQEKHGAVTAVITAQGQCADTHIAEYALAHKSNPNLTVVSSDRYIKDAAKKARLACLRSEEFLGTYFTGQSHYAPRPDSEVDVDYWLEVFSEEEDSG